MTADREPLAPKIDSYDDRFVTIDPATCTLKLKHYLVFKPTLTVHIPSLLYIQRASEVVRRIGIKQHGFSHGVIWAKDWSRGGAIIGPKSGYYKSFVIKVQGDRFRIGFSVENPERFLAVLEYLCPGINKSTSEAELVWTDSKAESDDVL